MERQTLSLDLDALFPGESLEIGGQSIIIRPLSIEQIATISKQLKGFGSLLSNVGVTWDNYDTQESLYQIVALALENFPSILEEVINVRIEDLKVLPLEPIVQMVDKAIEVNLKSKESLTKNLKSLTERFLPEKKILQKKRKPNKK